MATAKCCIKKCRNIEGESGLKFYSIPHIRKTNYVQLSVARNKLWKNVCEFINLNLPNRVCNKHFYCEEPADLLDKDHPDWVPWLNLDPDNPDDDDFVQKKMRAYFNMEKPQSASVCCIRKCPNAKSNAEQGTFFEFPTLQLEAYLERVLSEKRLLIWLQIINQPDMFENRKYEALKICNLHFVSGIMADLIDVQNIDWIPTVGLRQELKIRNHVVTYELQNLITLIEDTKRELKYSKSMSQSSTSKLPQTTPTKLPLAVEFEKFDAGVKCILCLSIVALKSLNKKTREALDVFFKDKLRVTSELICFRCDKMLVDFHAFYLSMVNLQARAIPEYTLPVKLTSTIDSSVHKHPAIESAIGVPMVPRLVQESSTPEKKRRKLFEPFTANEFKCKLCSSSLIGKKGLNDHLFFAHKVKIICKRCKNRFSPDGYAAHKDKCMQSLQGLKHRLIKPKPIVNSTISPAASIVSKIPLVPPKINKISTVVDLTRDSTSSKACILSKPIEVLNRKTTTVVNSTDKMDEKYSCYICLEYFLPSEMMEHVKTHKPRTENSNESLDNLKTMVPPEILDGNHTACKICQLAIHKDEMEKHLKEHEKTSKELAARRAQEEINYTCEACKSVFKSMYSLEKHHQKHHESIKVTRTDKIECPECKSVVIWQNDIRKPHGSNVASVQRHMTVSMLQANTNDGRIEKSGKKQDWKVFASWMAANSLSIWWTQKPVAQLGKRKKVNI
ncbi:uncharacterized protein LOC129751788 isoform X2 [Uranotaenia lowii]|uniref:uncharacterized protein LOC129751788 isoform X2 n=1 Tax=Uranotaenia lowii TaxID=190385 RepID=UPI0024799A8E|nr:uncharacterized protein LOC129751788 isoform X2 [Uranotaenia lowii]